MQENTAEKSQALALETKSLKPAEMATSENLPKSVSLKLYELMNKVVAQEINPTTVKAACACATEIHRMLKLNQELKRGGQ
jgi:hypothetical protein